MDEKTRDKLLNIAAVALVAILLLANLIVVGMMFVQAIKA